MRTNDVRLALNICTYKREEFIRHNLSLLLNSKFFNKNETEYFGKLDIFVVDNASEIEFENTMGLHLIHNKNTGGAGGFQRGIEEIRRYDNFTHVIFMDDDVRFEMESFYILFDFLRHVDELNANRPIAGRMFDIDNPNIQWTAAEVWNRGMPEHIEFLRDVSDLSNPYIHGKVVMDSQADYGGFWFCCYPVEFVAKNDLLPLFIHCDDVEYGLRCGKHPIIIEGVQVWHETWEKKFNPFMLYYDTRNTLFVNTIYGLFPNPTQVLNNWKETITKYHVMGDFLSEYMVILAMRDYLRGLDWLKRIDSGKHHKKLQNVKTNKYKNAISWRIVQWKYKRNIKRIDKKMSVPKISVIVPVYNVEDYLDKCLLSIKNQTLKDIEVICIDDGSTDKSGQILDEYAAKDTRFKVIHKENGGYGCAMNIGINNAKGEYIGIVESDDYIDEKMYDELYKLSEDGTVDIVKANFWNCYYDEDGTETRVVNGERNHVPELDEPFTVQEHSEILCGHPSIWSAIYKRELLVDKAIGFKEVKGGGWVDNPFFFETLSCAKSIMWSSEPLYCYRTERENSSSAGYDPILPIERMKDNLNSIDKRHSGSEEVLKNAYARALMYIDGSTKEDRYAYEQNKVDKQIRNLLEMLDENVIRDDFNAWDKKNYYYYKSPLEKMESGLPLRKKILFYNWVPFDSPGDEGGGVTLYCRNLISEIIRNVPSVEVYFLSSGWAYDITRNDCYVREITNIFGDLCRTFEIVNSPVPAPQDMLFRNPTIAFSNDMLKATVKTFIEKMGGFDVIHFMNIEGLSLDVFDLKQEFKSTRFIYSIHNYVPICMTGFLFDRENKKVCDESYNANNCKACVKACKNRSYDSEMIDRAKFGHGNAANFSYIEYVNAFGFNKLTKDASPEEYINFTRLATQKLNANMDVILAVSERVKRLAIGRGFDSQKVITNYIGTKIASYQIGCSAYQVGDYLRIAFLGSNLHYVEKGYPFLLKALASLDDETKSKIDLVLTMQNSNEDPIVKKKLKGFHEVEIIHGYRHSDLHTILNGVNLGIVPVVWEDNLPQISIEMVAMGIPVLCSNAGGASELSTADELKFEAGNIEDFCKKLKAIVDDSCLLDKYWEGHLGLETFKEHIRKLMIIYGFNMGESSQIVLSDKEYQSLRVERNFLLSHFAPENVSSLISRIESLEQENRSLREGNNSLTKINNDLNYHISEVWKSQSFKIGRVVTFIPRKIRALIR